MSPQLWRSEPCKATRLRAEKRNSSQGLSKPGFGLRIRLRQPTRRGLFAYWDWRGRMPSPKPFKVELMTCLKRNRKTEAGRN